MRRTQVAVLSIALASAAVALSNGSIGGLEILLLIAMILATGVGPFLFGVAVRLLLKQATVPPTVSLLFGVALGVFQFVVPQVGGFVFMDSKPLSALFTIIFGAAFAELGIAAATGIMRRRRRDRVAPEA